MQFNQGVGVITTDDEEVGQLERVVIDPRSQEITHLIVKRGLLAGNDKVVPLGLVASAGEERIVLREGKQHFEALPDFLEEGYVPLNESEAGRQKRSWGHSAPPVYSYPAAGVPANWFRSLPEQPPSVHLQRNIPPETVPIQKGARVVDEDGKRVGNVEQVFTHEDSSEITHILISQGLLLQERKLVPVDWVNVLGEDEVRLVVTPALLEDLPRYE
jgi:sporulation protein YlmC with PRC-barrel domain